MPAASASRSTPGTAAAGTITSAWSTGSGRSRSEGKQRCPNTSRWRGLTSATRPGKPNSRRFLKISLGQRARSDAPTMASDVGCRVLTAERHRFSSAITASGPATSNSGGCMLRLLHRRNRLVTMLDEAEDGCTQIERASDVKILGAMANEGRGVETLADGVAVAQGPQDLDGYVRRR